jgi:hypothetical protein
MANKIWSGRIGAINRGKKSGKKGEKKRSGKLRDLEGLEDSGKSKNREFPRRGKKGGRKVEGSQWKNS